MSSASPARRNSSKPFIDPKSLPQSNQNKFQNGIEAQDSSAQNSGRNFPNVMTSPASFPVEHQKQNGLYHPNQNHPGSSDLSDTEEDSFSASSVTDVARPPDGDWGWFVVFASFMIHVIGKSCEGF